MAETWAADLLDEAAAGLRLLGLRALPIPSKGFVDSGINILVCETSFDFVRCDSVRIALVRGNRCVVAAISQGMHLLCAFEWTGDNELSHWRFINKSSLVCNLVVVEASPLLGRHVVEPVHSEHLHLQVKSRQRKQLQGKPQGHQQSFLTSMQDLQKWASALDSEPVMPTEEDLQDLQRAIASNRTSAKAKRKRKKVEKHAPSQHHQKELQHADQFEKAVEQLELEKADEQPESAPERKIIIEREPVQNDMQHSSNVLVSPTSPLSMGSYQHQQGAQEQSTCLQDEEPRNLSQRMSDLSISALEDCLESKPSGLTAFDEKPVRKQTEETKVGAGRCWRIAVRKSMYHELPDRRSSGLIRDQSIGRWENASWRLWGQELKQGSQNAQVKQEELLRKKLRALSATPCLLCGICNPCRCLRVDELDDHGQSISTASSSPTQQLLDECFADGVLDDIQEEDDSASRLAAHWRLFNTLTADTSKPAKRVEYQLWRRLRPNGNKLEEPSWWPRTPSEYGPEQAPVLLGDVGYNWSLLPPAAMTVFSDQVCFTPAMASMPTTGRLAHLEADSDIPCYPEPMGVPIVRAPMLVSRREAELEAKNAMLEERVSTLEKQVRQLLQREETARGGI